LSSHRTSTAKVPREFQSAAAPASQLAGFTGIFRE
jgi:hypothetical protein